MICTSIMISRGCYLAYFSLQKEEIKFCQSVTHFAIYYTYPLNITCFITS